MDIRHFYVEQGEGEALIMLHGNGEDSSYFSSQIPFFARYFHVYALDTRGHGRTERGTEEFSIRQFARDLKGFMDEHDIEKAHILGFSDGANTAMIFALLYPERVLTLILNGGNIDPSGVKRRVQIPIEIGYSIARRADERKAELLGLMVNDPAIKAEELSRIRCRTLVVAGTRDMIKASHTRLIAQSIKDCSLVFLKGSHFTAHERPDAFNEAVLSFLQRKGV